MRRPAAGTPAAAREDAILEAARLPREAWSRVRALAEGTRRDASIAIADREVTVGEEGTVDVAFTLPAGAYATTVMREVMKSALEEPPAADGEQSETAPD
jgi:tRNA(Glu) U13 pseudouridine synthase TruD